MAWIKDKIRHIGTDATGKQLWRVRTSEGEVTEAVYESYSGSSGTILPSVATKEKEAEKDG